MNIYNELEELGFFKWLDDEHQLVENDLTPDVIVKLKSDSIHLTVIHGCAFRWFRENHKLHGEPFSQKRPADNFKYAFRISGRGDIMYDGYNTYEEAELDCLKKLIELVKQIK